MKYKVGDRVKIKTWEKLVDEFGLDYDGDIEGKQYFSKGAYEDLIILSPDGVLTIIGIDYGDGEFLEDYYIMRGLGTCWDDGDIECIVYDPRDAIKSRFEILDL